MVLLFFFGGMEGFLQVCSKEQHFTLQVNLIVKQDYYTYSRLKLIFNA